MRRWWCGLWSPHRYAIEQSSGLRAEPLTVRRAQPADLLRLAALLEHVSDETRYLRYGSPLPGSRAWAWFEAERLVRQDGAGALTVLVTTPMVQPPEIIGIGELVWSHDSTASGEVALLVRDGRQRRGVGTTLGRALLALAKAQGMTTVHAHLLPENRASLRLLRRLRVAYATTFDGELLHVAIQTNGTNAQPA
jgi:RimJ/RimL family protein N-acetyltransferase